MSSLTRTIRFRLAWWRARNQIASDQTAAVCAECGDTADPQWRDDDTGYCSEQHYLTGFAARW